MTIKYVDSMGHYNSAALGREKCAYMVNFGAGGGAFGENHTDHEIINFASTARVTTTGYYQTSLPAMEHDLLHIGDADGTHVRLRLCIDGRVRLRNGSLTTILAESAPNVLQFNAQHSILTDTFISDTVGSFSCIIDGVPVIATAANLDTKHSASGVALASQVHYETGQWSHFAVGDNSADFTGQPRVGCVFASGPGASSDWTPSAGANWECINETSPNGTDENTADAPGMRDMYKFANAMPATAIILACVVTARVRKTEAGVCEIAFVVDPPVGAASVGPTLPVPGSYAFLQRILALNPGTGNPWTPAEANHADFEAGIETITVNP